MILGVSAYYHDSAAALIIDGEIVAAAQEERFTRIKHDPAFPVRSIESVLKQAGITPREVDILAFYDKPFLTFERLLESYAAIAPNGLRSFARAMPIWVKDKLFQKRNLAKAFSEHFEVDIFDRIRFSEHHYSHAASAYYPAPFDDATVLTVDGVGEWATTTIGVGMGADLTLVQEINFPHSIGLLYSAVTYYLGFKVNSGEYKVMGLAPYGSPRFHNHLLDNVIDLKPDGSFRLNPDYFNFIGGLTMTRDEPFERLLGVKRRVPEHENLTQDHMDLAASIQSVTEEILLRITDYIAERYPSENLCLAGGVALNCVANGKILRRGKFKNIWVQPAAGDAGGSLGAALAVWHNEFQQPKHPSGTDAMKGAYLGPEFSQAEIEERLDSVGASYTVVTSDQELVETTANLLAEGKFAGWFQGRMEFGPRSLGARSIIADPRSSKVQRDLNLKIKYRESFRPFAPAILADDVSQFFDFTGPSPYMLFVANVLVEHRLELTADQEQLFGIEKLNIPRSVIPAVTHVDYSARLQTVHPETNPLFHALLSSFKKITATPILVNTSFNVRGEPIVCTPEDAFRCFMGTELDILVIGRCILYKDMQSIRPDPSFKEAYELD
ncbi:carbamoyltransferase [Brucella sp. BTU2]|nr:carbamoyltransferase [Ochrobactrum sp. BTU2]